MPTLSKRMFWLLGLATVSLSAIGAESTGRSSAEMSVGLILVAADAQDIPLPVPAELDYPASPSAVLCSSEVSGYRECATPFRGRVTLSRELDGTRCIENNNWGWREGVVWVDRGCAAIFLRQAAAVGV